MSSDHAANDSKTLAKEGESTPVIAGNLPFDIVRQIFLELVFPLSKIATPDVPPRFPIPSDMLHPVGLRQKLSSLSSME